MAFDVDTLMRAIHILAAALWAGAGIFLAFVLGPSFAKAGPAAAPFLMVALRRGGFAWFFMTVGFATILTGGHLYATYGYHLGPFASARATMITLGAVFAILALAHALATIVPTERKLRAIANNATPGAAPAAEQAAEFGRLARKQGKASGAAQAMVALALILMLASRLA